MGKPWIDLLATKQSYVSHFPDGRTYSVDALTTHWGGSWAYAYPPHMHCYPRYYPKLSLHSTINSPSFPSSSVVPNFVKPVNIDTSQVTSKQQNAQTTSVACIASPIGSIVSLCIDIISKSKHQQQHISYCFVKEFYKSKLDISNMSIYLTTLLKNFRQRQN